LAQRQPGATFHHRDLALPTNPIEVFQNTRDAWDVYGQVVADMEAGGCYTHLWGHGTTTKVGTAEALEAQLAKLASDRALRSRVWSTSSERAARYILQRRFSSIAHWRDEDGVWAYELSLHLPPDVPSSLMGKPVFNAPLTLKHPNVPPEPARFVYEDTPTGLRRLHARLEHGTLYYHAVPRGQTIRISPRPLHPAASKPNVTLSAERRAVTRPCDGLPVRGGVALELLVTATDPHAEIVSCQVTVRDPAGKPFVDRFGRRIENHELPENDWLDGPRGLILYPLEAGHESGREFALEAKAVNAHGEATAASASVRA
jgi:hypothetical protein